MANSYEYQNPQPIKNLSYYFSPTGVVHLDKTTPKLETAEQVIAALSKCNKLMAFTATMDLKLYGHLSLLEKYNIMDRTIKNYIQYNIERGCTVYAVMELTASYTPHAHIITNGYIYNFKLFFLPLGKNNKSKGAIQKLKSFDGWTKYIKKEDCRFEKLNITKPHYWSLPIIN